MNPQEKYHPFYCEENTWWLCKQSLEANRPAYALFITNPNKLCLMWHQKAQGIGQPILWDYHVVGITSVLAEDESTQWIVQDPDTRLSRPISVRQYLQKSFFHLFESSYDELLEPFIAEITKDKSDIYGDNWRQVIAPYFRLVSAQDLVANLCSDRSHMLDDTGDWIQEPPPWPQIQAPNLAEMSMNLMEFAHCDGGQLVEEAPGCAEHLTLRTIDGVLSNFDTP